MANKMLIDAAHPEETRVVVIRGSRVEEFDFEAASKKQLRGNIYLAKVTRVEPSLQAAFVDYGGNRHGFLAFSEIHPDYYQIPVSDRQALIEADAQEEPEEEERRPARRSRRHRRGDRPAAADAHRNREDSVSEPAGTSELENGEALVGEGDQVPAGETEIAPAAAEAREPADETVVLAAPVEHDAAPEVSEIEAVTQAEDPADAEAEAPAEAAEAEPAEPHVAHHHHGGVHHHRHEKTESLAPGDAAGDDEDSEDEEEDVSEHVEQLGGDAMEELPVRAYRNRRQYKIQEVIKRRQVLLVQVVKEERGNKGAALTTYLSLAGRYSVLMPNTAKGGGISRKITDAGDRQRLKSIAQDLEVPEGMGVILRTAGASRTKPEVKRDFEYLMRMWETVRENTLKSQAPTLVYEEGSLIKRSIRDLYNKDVEEIIVAGEAGYREAKDFMRLLMPSHARNVQPWHDPQPLFTKAGAEAQLDAMFSSHVTLRSGGYIVINQTEALVAIDVNSGRSTREHNIEDTALRTNLEAADEVARQLRLRDLAGLIVVDFIDMEENRNNRAVEKRIKDALKNDRARIQVGRISHFGLLEMSRQRIRTGVLEGSTVVCAHCAGAGMVRSTSSIALHVLRVLEDALISDASYNVTVRTRAAVALYILNNKRHHLSDIEARFGVAVTFTADETLTGTSYCGVERGEPATGIPLPPSLLPKYEPEPEYEDEEDEVGEAGEDETAGESDAQGAPADGAESEGQRRKRRRRRRGRDRESSGITEDAPQPADDALAFVADVEAQRIVDETGPVEEEAPGEGTDVPGREPRRSEGGRRRRSRRGGRRTREEIGAEQAEGAPTEADESGEDDESETESPVADAPAPEAREPVVAAAPASVPEPAAPETAPEESVPPAPVTSGPKAAAPPEPSPAAEEPVPAAKKPDLVSTEADPAQPKRSGWWQRAKATLGG
ncbi:MAG: Rne/Rng family ribonuclease [Beijerinckiaceae bacterium]|nr:Rne/Rng family ribonuclease [Beijerinckiaceae bacterium]